MSVSSTNKDIIESIGQDLSIDLPLEIDDADMIRMIADRVEHLLKADPDLLMSYLYRLDVLEKKINAALESSLEPAHFTLARLIWDRQKKRIKTKKRYKQKPIEGWEF